MSRPVAPGGRRDFGLEIDGRAVGVVIDDPAAAADLVRSEVTRHLVEREAAVSFTLTAPAQSDGLWLLTDRCSTVLARSRKRDDVVSSLLGHLAAFEPAPEGAIKLSAEHSSTATAGP